MNLKGTSLLTEAERTALRAIVDAPYRAGGQCPFCMGSGDPEPDRDHHEPGCKVTRARRMLDAEKDVESIVRWLDEERAEFLGGVSREVEGGRVAREVPVDLVEAAIDAVLAHRTSATLEIDRRLKAFTHVAAQLEGALRMAGHGPDLDEHARALDEELMGSAEDDA